MRLVGLSRFAEHASRFWGPRAMEQRRDWWIDSDEALRYGIVDEII